jgi:hypothetical protein
VPSNGFHGEGHKGAAGRFGSGKVSGDAALFIGRNFILVLAISIVFFYLPVLLFDLQAAREASQPIYSPAAGGVAVWLTKTVTAIAPRLLVIAPIFFGQAVLSKAAAGQFTGNRPSLGGCLLAALRRFLPLFGLGAVMFLVTNLGQQALFAMAPYLPSYGNGIILVLLQVPVFAFGFSIILVVPVIMQEGRGLIVSMSRARALSRGCRWPIFGMISVVTAATCLGFWATSGVVAPGEAMPVYAALVWLLASTLLTAAYVELCRIKDGPGAAELSEIFS